VGSLRDRAEAGANVNPADESIDLDDRRCRTRPGLRCDDFFFGRVQFARALLGALWVFADTVGPVTSTMRWAMRPLCRKLAFVMVHMRRLFER